MIPMESELVGLVKWIRELIARGLKRDEILARLADPAGVGADMLDRAVARRAAGEAYLGRDPEAIMVRTEPPPPPRMSRRVTARVLPRIEGEDLPED